MSRGDCSIHTAGRLRPWLFELLGAFFSVTLLAALAVLLAVSDGKPIFDDGIVTLNALVAVLSTSSKSAVLFTVAGAISQWNWILFAASPRRLYDFERVTDASRGPLGSVKLLFNAHFRGGVLVRLGALITILSMALDPFAQQLVQLDQQMKFVANGIERATVPKASRYSRGTRYRMSSSIFSIVVTDEGRLETLPQPVFADADFPLQSAMIFGTTAARSAISQQLGFNCPSSECTFPPVSSLAVCSQCKDLTSHLKRDTLGSCDQYLDLSKEIGTTIGSKNCTTLRLPNGLFMNNEDGSTSPHSPTVLMTMMGTDNTSNTIAMGHIDTLIWSQSMIKIDGGYESKKSWPDYDIRASECALYYCVKNYTTVVRNATLIETATILEDQKRVPGSWAINDTILNNTILEKLSDVMVQNLAFHRMESIVQRTDLQLGGSNGKFGWNLSQSAVNGISAFVQKTFATCILDERNCTIGPSTWGPINGYMLGGVDQQYAPNMAKALWDTKDINETFYNIAMSMSNAIRNGADDSEAMSGLIGVPTTVYAVDWRWISLQAAVVLAAVTFLILTILTTLRGKNGRVPAWKSSELAVFSRGFMVGEGLRGAETIEQFEERAKAMSVSLLDGWGGGQSLPLADIGLDPMLKAGGTGDGDWQQVGSSETGSLEQPYATGLKPYGGGGGGEADVSWNPDTAYPSTTLDVPSDESGWAPGSRAPYQYQQSYGGLF